MTLFDIVQNAIIGAIVLISAVYVLRRLLPKWTRAQQTTLAAAFDQPQRPALLRRLGRFLQPGESSGGGCGSGCNTCSTCESNPEADSNSGNSNIKPLEFHRHI
ncbi:MAG TPA: DUF6587 family protein [Oxalicibacterium sp.]|uniref:DUF6587 family protein n=1 Tax=Oxalicibacterium sp. TaxID=2766525 RepID=UPI002B937C8D|nr:DUF6587 family protein [Oxalicibacterium sp.]HWU97567.1 DUF6587 family protein [Oxalicibacterium sp.]